MMAQQITTDMLFEVAAPLWLEMHSRDLKPRTIQDYGNYIKTVGAFFGKMPLAQISVERIREYQEQRSATAGAARINMEMSTVQQILKEAGLWPTLGGRYKPLRISMNGAGRALSPEDETALFEIAFSNSRRLVAAHCLRIMYKSGCGFGELRRVRRRDIDLQDCKFEIVDGAKNEKRRRVIPLNAIALESMQWLLARWERLGGSLPEDYLLPHCSNESNGFRDFSRPMGSIKKAWEGIRNEAIKQIGPHMAKLRIYDARSTAITNVLKSGKVPIHTAEKLFGHVSRAMQMRYFRPHLDDLAKAADVLDPSHSKPVAAAIYSGAAKADAAMGVSVSSLMESLERAGLPAEKILQVIKETFGKTA